MKIALYFLLGVVFCISTAFSVDTTGIESLRLSAQDSGSELSDSELAQISRFWTAAMDQMLLAKSSLEMVEVRRQLETQKGKENLSYYSAAYVSQAIKSIQSGFENSTRLEEPKQRQLVQRNLMILAANLQSLKLVPLALEYLGSKDDVIRYWACKAVTQPAIVLQLTDDVTQDEDLTAAILNGLTQHIGSESHLEIQTMAAKFCMAFDQPAAREILLLLAGRRAKAYRDWNIGNALPETPLLMGLGNMAMAQRDAQIKSDVGRAFSELLAMVMQRYILALEGNPDDQFERVQTILAKVDQDVLMQTMELKTSILSGMKTKNTNVLKREYETLFGDRLRQGQLGDLFKFDYGKDASGKALTHPPVLQPKPEAVEDQG